MANNNANPTDQKSAPHGPASAPHATMDVTNWMGWLSSRRTPLPASFVASFGSLALMAQLSATHVRHLSALRAAVLRKVAESPEFVRCAHMIAQCPDRELRNEAIGVLLQILGRVLLPSGTHREADDDAWDNEARYVLDRRSARLIDSVDMIRVRTSTRLKSGARLLDFELIDECLKRWDRMPERPLQSHSVPENFVGDKNVSRREGMIAGFTAVRPRLPTDNLTEILPSDWALVKKNRMVGFDKLLNRDTLVYSRESPIDRVPRPRVLLTMVIDVDTSLQGARFHTDFLSLTPRQMAISGTVRAKALAYRMVADCAEQAPFDIMNVQMAVYVKDSATSELLACAGFDLQAAQAEGHESVQCFDELVQNYFCHRPDRKTLLNKDLPDDPFTLMGMSAGRTTYSAVLAVLFAERHRWENVLPDRLPNLRPMGFRRNTVLMVQSSSSGKSRSYQWRAFTRLSDSVSVAGASLESSTDLAPRRALLEMLLGTNRKPPRKVNSAIEMETG